MTAHAMQGDREMCLEAGMDGYITKPVDPLSLAEELAKWLPKESEAGSRKAEGGGQEAEENRQPSPAVWDRAALLGRLMGDEELAETIVQGFLADMPLHIEALRGSVEAGDAAAAGLQAHTIKGASANLGGEALRALAFGMEKAGKAGDMESIEARLDELAASFEELKQVMAAGHFRPLTPET